MTDKKPEKLEDEKIAYEPHPVTPERKKELRQQGYKIIDLEFAPAEVKAKYAAEAKAAAAKKGGEK